MFEIVAFIFGLFICVFLLALMIIIITYVTTLVIDAIKEIKEDSLD